MTAESERGVRGREPIRIVSLLPSATEILCALGAGPWLVGRSHECDYPAEIVSSLPVCTRAHVGTGTSREIDEDVARRLARGLSLYDVDAEALARLAPDIVFTQDQCAVCAVGLADVETALRGLTGHPVEVVSLSPSTLGDVFLDIGRAGAATGLADRATELCAELSRRLADLGERTGAIRRETVVCLEWIDPPMTAGNWTPELVRLAGGESLLARAGHHSPRITWRDLAASDPQVLVVTACGFDLERTRREVETLRAHPRWPGLRAVRAGRVFATDGNAYFNRSGPRLVESAEILAEILHPDVFDFGHRGRGWTSIQPGVVTGVGSH